MSLQNLIREVEELVIQRKGGAGSGNIGHAGVKGHRGGSASKGGGGSGGASGTGSAGKIGESEARNIMRDAASKSSEENLKRRSLKLDSLGVSKNDSTRKKFEEGRITATDMVRKLKLPKDALTLNVKLDSSASSFLKQRQSGPALNFQNYRDMSKSDAQNWGKLFSNGLAKITDSHAQLNDEGEKFTG